MDLGLTQAFASAGYTEPKSETASVCPNRRISRVNEDVFFCHRQEDKVRTGVRGGEIEEGDEEMEDHVEMEEDSNSNVSILQL